MAVPTGNSSSGCLSTALVTFVSVRKPRHSCWRVCVPRNDECWSAFNFSKSFKRRPKSDVDLGSLEIVYLEIFKGAQMSLSLHVGSVLGWRNCPLPRMVGVVRRPVAVQIYSGVCLPQWYRDFHWDQKLRRLSPTLDEILSDSLTSANRRLKCLVGLFLNHFLE